MAITKIRGNTQIIDLSIEAAQLAADSVSTVKIVDDAVTADKLRDDASTDANRAVTTNHIRDAAVTDAKVATGIDAVKIADGTVDNTEFQRLNGVTGDIQTQLDGKASTALDNLASVAINVSLISDTNNTDDLGSDLLEWKDAWVHAVKHADATNPNLTIMTGSDNGNIILDPHGTGVINASSARITNVASPTADGDAATKSYVDGVATGLDVKDSVRLATDAALPANTAAGSGVGKTLTADADGALSVDGVAVAVGDRILVKDEATASDNGIYEVTQTGDGLNPYILTRATDADEDTEVTAGLFTFVAEGTTNSDRGFVLTTNDPITVDTTALSFSQFSGAGQIEAGAGLLKTGDTIDFVAADTSLVVNADDAAVRRDPAGAITLDGGGAGIEVNTDGTSIEINTNALRIASGAAGDGLGYAAGVLSVNVAGTGGIEIVSDNVQIKTDTVTANTIGVTTTSDGAGVLFDSNSFVDSGSETLALAANVAGDGLALTTGVLSVNVDNVGIEIVGDTLQLKDDGIFFVETRQVVRETPTGLVNGTNTVFTTANNFTAGSEHVYLNGVLQNEGAGNDYTVTAANEITFESAPQTGDVILITYWKA